MTTAPTTSAPRKMREGRRPFGSLRQKLAYESRMGYHRHWFNDDPGRIEQALQAGYTHVEDKEGRKVQMVVGVSVAGGALVAFLMEIPEEFYKSDMAEQQKQIDEMDQAIRRGSAIGTEAENRYVPSRGITIRDAKGKAS